MDACRVPARDRPQHLLIRLDGQAQKCRRKYRKEWGKDLGKIIRGLAAEFQPTSNQSCRAKLGSMRQETDGNILIYVRRVEDLVEEGYPGTNAKGKEEFIIGKLRDPCLEKYQVDLGMMEDGLGLATIEKELGSFESHTSVMKQQKHRDFMRKYGETPRPGQKGSKGRQESIKSKRIQ